MKILNTGSRLIPLFCAVFLGVLGVACGGPKIQRERYAELSDERTYEEEFPLVTRAIEDALHAYPLTEKKIGSDQASFETDWVYSQSRDKYATYEVEKKPKRKKLQVRFRYQAEAEKVLGGVKVRVGMDEEIEKLDSKGEPDGYSRQDKVDTSRLRELQDKIKNSMLAAP